MMTKFALLPDFKLVSTLAQMIVFDLFNKLMLIQLLQRDCEWFYAPLLMVFLYNEKVKWPTLKFKIIY